MGSDALVEEDGVLREQIGCVQGGRGRGEGMQIGFDPRLKVPKEETRGRIEEVQGRLFLGKGGDEIGVRVREATFHGRGAPAVVREELGDATQGVRQIDAREGGVEEAEACLDAFGGLLEERRWQKGKEGGVEVGEGVGEEVEDAAGGGGGGNGRAP